METTRIASTTAALAFAALLAPTAATAEGIEITPFAGYRFGGDFGIEDRFGPFDVSFDLEDKGSYGVVLDFPVTRGLQIELLADHQETELRFDPGFLEPGVPILDLDVDYYHIGLLYQWAPGDFRPFLVGSLGVTELSPSTPGLTDESFFSVSVGGGVKVLATEHIGVRLEGRFFSTVVQENGEVFCDPDFCFVQDETLDQFEASVGLILKL
jgi:hypothetical protein